MAPEVYRRESYGKSVDVFSFALIVHEVTLKLNFIFTIYFQLMYFAFQIKFAFLVSYMWSWVCFCLQMIQGGPSNRADTAVQVADRRAYEDSRPALSSLYPEPIKA